MPDEDNNSHQITEKVLGRASAVLSEQFSSALILSCRDGSVFWKTMGNPIELRGMAAMLDDGEIMYTETEAIQYDDDDDDEEGDEESWC